MRLNNSNGNNNGSSGNSRLTGGRISLNGQGRARRGAVRSEQRNLRDYLLMIRERWVLGAITAAVLVTLLAFHQLRKPEVFEGHASIVFEIANPQVVDIEEVVDTSLHSGTPELRLQTHVEQVKSSSFFRHVAETFSEEEKQRLVTPYLDSDQPPPALGGIIMPGIDASLSRGTYILTISARHRDPEMAALIANRYAAQYIDYNRQQTESGNRAALSFLREQERELRQQVEKSEAALQDYQRQHNLVSLEESQNIVVRRLNSLSAQVVKARVTRLELDSQMEHVNHYLTNEKDLLEIDYIAEYGSVPRLRDELKKLEAERAVLEERYLEMHPKVTQNARSIESIESQLRTNIRMAVNDLLSRHQRAVNHEAKLEEQLAEAEAQSLELEEVAVQYNVLRRQVEADRTAYARIVDRLNETMITSQLDHINIKPVDTASPPKTPVEPNLQKIILQSAFIGGLIFLGLPLTLGLLDQKLKAAWEVEFLLGLPLLGEIPKMTNVKRRDRAHIISKGDPNSASEAFRGIFSQLELNTPKNDSRMILITSTVPGEGKTVVASNLAATFAGHGKRTLLVDCDFRRPALHHYYERKNDRGILRWLEMDEAGKEPLQPGEALGILPLTHNFDLLRAGGESRNPTEMLNTADFKDLLRQFKKDYDIVIVDTPPVGIFPDALLLARLCDQILYVCQFNRVNKTQIRKYIEKVEMAKVEVGGLILNGLPSGRSSAYYDYFGYGQIGNREYKAYYSRKAG